MRLYACQACQHTIYFENVRCVQCGRTLAYLPDARCVSALEACKDDPELYVALSGRAGAKRYRLCANSADYGACNWAVPANTNSAYCDSCRLNNVIPDLGKAESLEAWRELERNKRRLFCTLQALGLPIESRRQRDNGLLFSFMADAPDGSSRVFTGHNDGNITINIAEADDPFREKIRKQLGESYRTVLGHLRHEIGHYYWDRLIKDGPWLEACRSVFGDETTDYAQALKKHYNSAPPRDWTLRYVSSYATMHPWEDWAETWAHYMHMVDTLETARAHDLAIKPRPVGGAPKPQIRARALDFDNFDDLLRGWIPLTVTLNSLNRSMGVRDPYPFVLSVTVVQKLRFVHEVIEHANAGAEVQAQAAQRFLLEAAEETKRERIKAAMSGSSARPLARRSGHALPRRSRRAASSATRTSQWRAGA